MPITYLDREIESARRTATPHYGMAAEGYTVRTGAPTSLMIRLVGEKRERRLMCWQFSNVGTLFVRIGGQAHIVREHDIPELSAPAPAPSVAARCARRADHPGRCTPAVDIDYRLPRGVPTCDGPLYPAPAPDPVVSRPSAEMLSRWTAVAENEADTSWSEWR